MKTIKNEFKNTAVAAPETDFFKRVERIKAIPSDASDAEIEASLGITFDTFKRCIKRIQQGAEFFDSLYALGIDVAGVPSDRICDELINLLEITMSDTRNCWISFFIYNMDFGSRADEVIVMDNGKEISLSNIEELWELLVHEIGEEMRKEQKS